MEYTEAMEHAEFTIQIRREALNSGEDVYVALCLELDIVSQGDTAEQAKVNVTDAVEAFFEVASPSETERRLPFRLRSHSDLFLTSIEVSLGQTARSVGAESL